MDLRRFEGNRVRLENMKGRVFEGYASDYIFADDNEPEVEGIVLNYPVRDDGYKYPNPVEFDAPEIRSIEIIE